MNKCIRQLCEMNRNLLLRDAEFPRYLYTSVAMLFSNQTEAEVQFN